MDKKTAPEILSCFLARKGLGQPTSGIVENEDQPCFYEANLTDFSFKGDQVTMEAPIFSLSTKLDKELWGWSSVDGKKSVEVAPGFQGPGVFAIHIDAVEDRFAAHGDQRQTQRPPAH